MKITSKDLINLGVFTLLSLVVTVFAFGITLTPVIQFSRMAINALLSAPIFLLFVAKTGKPFMISIMGVICSVLISGLMFGGAVYAVVTFIFFLAAELIAYLGKYKNFKLNQLSYIVCSFWTFGPYGIWWYDTEHAYQLAKSSYDSIQGYEGFADQILVLINPTTLIITLALTLLASIVSIFFAKRLFRKHFKKAGLV